MNKKTSFIKKNGVNLLSLILIILSIAFALLFRTNSVSGSSMEPNYSSGDIVITQKKTKELSRGDVVTLNGNRMTAESGDIAPNMIKRIVGEPGDNVVLKNNKLYINNEQIKEVYISEEMVNVADAEYELADDEYFVLGDNRNHSTDSRDYGPVKKDWIDGRAVYTLYHAK